jgi:hypothetical protein
MAAAITKPGGGAPSSICNPAIAGVPIWQLVINGRDALLV